MRVVGSVIVAIFCLCGWEQLQEVGGVEDPRRLLLRDRLVEGRLITRLVDHQVCVGDRCDLLRGKLQVVAVAAGRKQIGHHGQVARHPLGGELERVSADNDGSRVAGA